MSYRCPKCRYPITNVNNYTKPMGTARSDAFLAIACDNCDYKYDGLPNNCPAIDTSDVGKTITANEVVGYKIK